MSEYLPATQSKHAFRVVAPNASENLPLQHVDSSRRSLMHLRSLGTCQPRNPSMCLLSWPQRRLKPFLRGMTGTIQNLMFLYLPTTHAVHDPPVGPGPASLGLHSQSSAALLLWQRGRQLLSVVAEWQDPDAALKPLSHLARA